MKSLNVIVADADRDALMLNTKQLSKMADIDVIASTMYGEEVIRAVCSSDVDVVVTDIVLKGIDGIGVLEAFGKMDKPSLKKLILTRMNTAFVQDAVFERGANFFMTKPTTPKLLYERIRMLGGAQIKKKAEPSIDADLSVLLRKMGVSPEKKGFSYLQEAVRIRVSMGSGSRKLTEKVYPAIADRFSTTPESVERAIRTAIGSAWKSGAIQKFAVEAAGSAIPSRNPTAGQMIDNLCRYALDRIGEIN